MSDAAEIGQSSGGCSKATGIGCGGLIALALAWGIIGNIIEYFSPGFLASLETPEVVDEQAFLNAAREAQEAADAEAGRMAWDKGHLDTFWSILKDQDRRLIQKATARNDVATIIVSDAWGSLTRNERYAAAKNWHDRWAISVDSSIAPASRISIARRDGSVVGWASFKGVQIDE